MIRNHHVRTAAGCLLSAALVVVGLGALSQVPLSAVGPTIEPVLEPVIEVVLGREPETGDQGTSATTPTATPARHDPLTLHVAAWDEDFDVVDVAVNGDGALVPPDDVSTLGRWDQGAWPGDGSGTVALVVHRDSAEQGRGPFAALEELRPGSRVTLDGRTYRLETVETYPKSDLPTTQVFDRGGSERLVVVTCGGSYSDDSGWDSNVVATFRPAST